MGLLSLFSSRKSDDEPMPRAGRGRRSAALDDDMLDPDLPQKQRARRRLIGAVVLMLLAVILLPLLFETEPKPVNEDVVVRMPDSDQPKPRLAAQSERKVEPRRPDADAPAAQGLDEGETVVQASAQSTPAPAPETEPAKVASPAKYGKYNIMNGAFSNEDGAQNWQAKHRAAKTSNYIETKKFEDGERNLLRAGPFNDHDSALEAEKKVKSIGLTAIVREL